MHICRQSNRVIGTASLVAPGPACLLTNAPTFFLLHSTNALYCRRVVSSRYKLSDETCLMQDSTLAGSLANVCNTIQYGTNTVCQGFVYDNEQKVAFFKGGTNGQPVNTSSVLCSSPTGTAWLRDTGRRVPHHSVLKSASVLCSPKM